jgi:hypothetical protein
MNLKLQNNVNFFVCFLLSHFLSQQCREELMSKHHKPLRLCERQKLITGQHFLQKTLLKKKNKGTLQPCCVPL